MKHRVFMVLCGGVKVQKRGPSLEFTTGALWRRHARLHQPARQPVHVEFSVYRDRTPRTKDGSSSMVGIIAGVPLRQGDRAHHGHHQQASEEQSTGHGHVLQPGSEGVREINEA
ncbi:hypothetical protein E2C01_049483 [Portunus trituberculatus]|uniref:Uncharacterized protein n=1 Tax=Portunus trituberculatus TaxID=210409 RepID=A0A5B7G9J7_PORTR|nr:hypothetical protein [Portunus trituberculatus]